MSFISREAWGAQPPRGGQGMGTVDTVIVHHAVTAAGPDPAAICRQVQQLHFNQGHNDIAYSFLVSQDGDVYEGRGWGRVGGHTLGWNDRAYAVCFIGNAHGVDEPTEAAVNAIASVIADGIANGWVTPGPQVIGHRDAPGNSTACPGNDLESRLGDIAARVGGAPGLGAPAPAPAPGPQSQWGQGSSGQKVREIQQVCNAVGCNAGPADGVFGPQTAAGVRCFQAKVGVAADGVWGPVTDDACRRLFEYLDGLAAQPAPAIDPGLAASLEDAKRYQVQQGSAGDQVKWVQALVRNAGFDPGPVDGVFGPRTRQAVLAFQSSRGLQVDGIVGPQTWGALTS